jgi:hypothetical protein
MLKLYMELSQEAKIGKTEFKIDERSKPGQTTFRLRDKPSF